MPSFNVWKEPWIGLRYASGERREVGLGQALAEAHLAVELDDPLPAVACGLYRLLIALVMDIARWENLQQLRSALDRETLDLTRADEYYQRHSDRFDLFHPHHPFLQSRGTVEERARPSPIAALLRPVPSGIAVAHFHRPPRGGHAWSPAVCARALTAIAPFTTAGGSGYTPSINGAPPWYVLVRGANLKDTLLLNSWHGPQSQPTTDLGLPAWRQSSPIVAREERFSFPLLEGLTWQPRRICLLAAPAGSCTYSGLASPTLVREMVYTYGLRVAAPEKWRDPHVAYALDKEGQVYSLRPREHQPVWRHADALTLESAGRPQVVDQLQSLLHNGYRLGPALTLDCYGMRTDKMKVFEWRHETLALPSALLTHPQTQTVVSAALATVRDHARLLQKHLEDGPPEHGARAVRDLWQRLHEPFFSDFLTSPEENASRWQDLVKQAAIVLLEEYLAKRGSRPRAFVVATETSRRFRLALDTAPRPLTYPETPGPSPFAAALLIEPSLRLLKARHGPTFARQLRRLAGLQQGEPGARRELHLLRILECRSDQRLTSLLTRAFRLLSTARLGFDHAQLLADLDQWHRPDRLVQRRWAQEFSTTTDAITREGPA